MSVTVKLTWLLKKLDMLDCGICSLIHQRDQCFTSLNIMEIFYGINYYSCILPIRINKNLPTTKMTCYVLQSVNFVFSCTGESITVHLKVPVNIVEPLPVQDHAVPIIIRDKLMQHNEWDLTTQQVSNLKTDIPTHDS